MKLKQLFEHLREEPLEAVKDWAANHKGAVFHGSREKFTSFRPSRAQSQDLGIHFASDSVVASAFTELGSNSEWKGSWKDGTHREVKRTGILGLIKTLFSGSKIVSKPSYLYAVDVSGLKFLDLIPLLSKSDIIEWSYENLFYELSDKKELNKIFPSLPASLPNKELKKMKKAGEFNRLVDALPYDGFIYDNANHHETWGSNTDKCCVVFETVLSKIKIIDVLEVNPLDHEGSVYRVAQ